MKNNEEQRKHRPAIRMAPYGFCLDCAAYKSSKTLGERGDSNPGKGLGPYGGFSGSNRSRAGALERFAAFYLSRLASEFRKSQTSSCFFAHLKISDLG